MLQERPLRAVDRIGLGQRHVGDGGEWPADFSVCLRSMRIGDSLHHRERKEFICVENYLEAAGLLMAMRAGVHPSSVRRPLKHTLAKWTLT